LAEAIKYAVDITTSKEANGENGVESPFPRIYRFSIEVEESGTVKEVSHLDFLLKPIRDTTFTIRSLNAMRGYISPVVINYTL